MAAGTVLLLFTELVVNQTSQEFFPASFLFFGLPLFCLSLVVFAEGFYQFCRLVADRGLIRLFPESLQTPLLITGVGLYYAGLPLLFLLPMDYEGERTRIVAAALGVGFLAAAGFGGGRRFFPRPAVQTTLLVLFGLTAFIAGAAMYINQYHFLHISAFFYAWLPLRLALDLSFPDRPPEKARGSFPGNTTGWILLWLVLWLPGGFWVYSSPASRYQVSLKTTYIKYWMFPFIPRRDMAHETHVVRAGNRPKQSEPGPGFQPEEINQLLPGREGDGTPPRGLVVILIDTLRASSLPLYGYHRDTAPNLSQLAKKSRVFHAHRAQYSNTLQSLGSMFRSELMPWTRPEDAWLRYLKEKGFSFRVITPASTAKYYSGWSQTVVSEPTPDLQARLALNYLKQRQMDQKKFLLWIHLLDVHTPYREHPEKSWGSSPRDRYDSEIYYTDAGLAPLFEYLGRGATDGRFFYALTSDHGEEFREHGGRHHTTSVYEEIIRVPLIMGGPGITPGNTQMPTSHMDLVPTWLSLLSENFDPPPPGFTDWPRASLLAPPGSLSKRPVFAHSRSHFFTGPVWAVIRGERKLILRPAAGLAEYYDLDQDPTEQRNLFYVGQNPSNHRRWLSRLRADYEVFYFENYLARRHLPAVIR